VYSVPKTQSASLLQGSSISSPGSTARAGACCAGASSDAGAGAELDAGACCAGGSSVGAAGRDDGPDTGRSVLDAARALRHLLGTDRISERAVVYGHSQGGGAALAAAAYSDETPDVKVGADPQSLRREDQDSLLRRARTRPRHRGFRQPWPPAAIATRGSRRRVRARVPTGSPLLLPDSDGTFGKALISTLHSCDPSAAKWRTAHG
jgi:pimeloyl-ACP methyl ester carboxylesterase